MTTEIKYLTGDATYPVGSDKKVIIHLVNDIGKWGKGFVLALSKRWPKAEADYREWHKELAYKGKDLPLGSVRYTPVEGDITIIHIVGQKGINKKGKQPIVRINYKAVRSALETVAFLLARPGIDDSERQSVHMPRIGTGLAGGDWSEVEKIIEETLCAKGIPVTVYTI